MGGERRPEKKVLYPSSAIRHGGGNKFGKREGKNLRKTVQKKRNSQQKGQREVMGGVAAIGPYGCTTWGKRSKSGIDKSGGLRVKRE